MNEFRKCLKIVDKIIIEGGYGTIAIYLASEMRKNSEVYENILESSIHGKKVRDIIGDDL